QLRMNGGEGDECGGGDRQRAPAGRVGDAEQAQQAGDDQRGRPREMGDRQDRIPAADLRKVEVERLDPGAQEGWVAQGLGEKAGTRAQDDEYEGETAELRRQQAAAELVGGEYEGDRAGDAGQVIGGDQRYMKIGRASCRERG